MIVISWRWWVAVCLVTLLTGMYQPTRGRVLVDGVELADIDLTAWRAHSSGAFQVHAAFEFSALESIGVGDEPTSALDAATEHALFDRYAAAAAEAGRRGAVTLLVTHRFSTVAAADTVLVLDHGRVVEHGTHDELVRSGGKYAELYGLQARGYR